MDSALNYKVRLSLLTLRRSVQPFILSSSQEHCQIVKRKNQRNADKNMFVLGGVIYEQPLKGKAMDKVPFEVL